MIDNDLLTWDNVLKEHILFRRVFFMKLLQKLISSFVAAAICIPFAGSMTAFAEGNTRDVVIDGDKAITAENKLYRGAGMVTGNNSSRLLLDYKDENPEKYWEIMNYLFGDKGIGLEHIKIEMGSDINSSSGTEPNIMRSEDETPDVTRGAGYQLAADAQTINPDITLDMLYWSEPRWVTDAEDVYAARYKWYKATLDAAYETYGLEFEYVSAVRNERTIDVDWIKYLASSLDNETDCPYDYSAIKVVAADEVTSWSIADSMLKDPELMEAIDVVGSHYTSWSSDNAKKLADEYGKELWFSEASTPMAYSKGTYRFDGTGSGLNDLNGVLDIANRFITMFPGGYMTMCEYQPVVAAYYDGVTYCQKQMILANSPWDGSYMLDNGYYMALHFSQFIDKGWAFIDEACYGDGVKGGDGHAIVDAVYSYITATDTATDDYSTVVTNTTAEPITYNFTVKNLDKASAPVYVWETKGSGDSENWKSNYFRHIDTITPTENNGEYTFSYTVQPYSLVTLSTIERQQSDYEYEEQTSAVLELPYADDFEYEGYAADYLSTRGYAPRYTTDEGGAFEVVELDGNNVLQQKITLATKADEWGGTPEPTTNFGDDRWFNYSVSADVGFDADADGYVGVGLRYNSAYNGASGYWIKMNKSGKWELMRHSSSILSGNVDGFDSTAMTNLKIEAVNDTVRVYVNGTQVCEYNCTESGTAVLAAGRAALYSSYDLNIFDNVQINTVDGAEPYITRFDNLDAEFEYSEGWKHKTMDSYKNYKRTLARCVESVDLTFTFSGTGVAFTGITKDAVISVELDGEMYAENVSIANAKQREVEYLIGGLENGEHSVKITCISGSFAADGAEVVGMPITTAKQLVHNEVAADTESTTESVEDSTASDGKTSNEAAGETVAGDSAQTDADEGGNIAVPIAIGAAIAAIIAVVAVIFVKKKK